MIVALGVIAAACGGGGGDGGAETEGGGDPASADDAAAVDRKVGNEPVQPVSSPSEDVPSALADPANAVWDDTRLVDADEVLSGGPPPDGIPAIDDPKFAPASEIDFLEDNEPVVSLQIGDEVRAYPIQVMTWHEIVNDQFGDVPVTVTFCPLCNSALAYNRQVGDRVLEFGTSGLLHNSALVMYDRQTETLWDHFNSRAIIGELAGEELEVFPMQTVGWADWREANPDGLVLTRDTGFERRYGNNPYSGYDDINRTPYLFRGESDDRRQAMERFVTVRDEDLPEELRSGADPVAVAQADLVELGVLEVEMGDVTLSFWAEPGTASALDDVVIAAGRDVGQTGVFLPEVDGRRLTFERRGDAFIDNETGSRWSVFGEAIEGELAGSKLQAVNSLNTFWFAWAASYPDTRILP